MNRSIWVVSVTLFLSMVGFGLTLPALPFFVERLALGLDPTPGRVTFHVGMLTSAYAFSQVVLGPTLGRWSDRLGRRPLLCWGLVGFAISQTIFGLGGSLPILYLARLGAGASGAALFTVSAAVVSDVLPQAGRARGLAWTGAAASMGIVVGPAMSGILSRGDMHGHQMVGSLMLDGFSIPFLVAAGLAVATLPMVLVFLAETAPAFPGRGNGPQPLPRLTHVLLLTTASQVILSAFEAVFALVGGSVLGWGLQRIGWGFVVCGGVMALQGGLAGLLSGRVPPRVQVAAGFAAMGLGTALLSLTTSFIGVLGSIAVLALGMAVIAPNLAAEAVRLRPDNRGSALGIQGTAGGIGRVIGPAAGSLLFTVQPTLPFLLASALAFAVAISLLRKVRAGHGSPPPGI